MPNEIITNNLKKHGFAFDSKIDSGGFGDVIKVKHNISNQFYAVKMLKENRKHNPEDMLREIQAIAGFNHPNIINYNHSFIENHELYLVMEYCSKGSLRDWLNKKGKFELDYSTNLFLRLTHTLDFLHKKGFVHHDIKPDNILFANDNKFKISDFGTVNTSIGTIIYSAPEMLLPDPPIDDPRTDIFSLGITLMECIIGENPLEDCDPQEHILKVKNADFPIKELPYWLKQLLLKACHFDPSARFQSMIEFYETIKKRHIPQILSKNVLEANKLANKLKMYVVGHRWNKAKQFIEMHDNDSIGYLIQKGKYLLGTNQLSEARNTFEEVLRKNPNTPIEKNSAEIYLQIDEPSKAASILHGFINNNFHNVEAHNQLLHSYFLSDQWELGLEQSKFLIQLFPKEIIFLNNLTLFEILLGKAPKKTKHLHEGNPIAYYNYHEVVKQNDPIAYDTNDKEDLKSKLLFHEYKFKNIHNSTNTISIEMNGIENYYSDHIISLGRKNYDCNTLSPFDDSQISRRHFILVNQKNNVWLYDLSTLGTSVDGVKVDKRAFLLGRCKIELGNHQLFIKSDNNLLL